MQDLRVTSSHVAPTLRAWLEAEPFTLALSAGFFGFFAHAGLLRAFAQKNLRPRRIIGVSAGALAGGVVAAGVPIGELEEALLRLRRVDFWDPGWSRRGLLEGQKFAHLLAELVASTGVQRLEECPTAFNAVVHDLRRHVPVLLHSGPLVDSIRASCALPVLFRPVQIGERQYIDGGVRDRPGQTGINPDERVLVHNLVSNSPWRHFFAPPRLAPNSNRRWLELPNLPRVTPFALHHGRAAMEQAYAATLQWLDSPPLP